MNTPQKLLMLLFVLATLNSCQTKNPSGDGTNGNFFNFISNPKDDLIGEFSLADTGKSQVKITKESGNYFVSGIEMNGTGGWSKPEQIANARDTDFVYFFGANWKDYVEAGLDNQKFGIFKVKKGYKIKDRTYTTGYVMLTFFGGLDAYKR